MHTEQTPTLAALGSPQHAACKGKSLRPRTWNLYATRSARSGTLQHIGALWWVKLHGLREAIVPVLVEERTDAPEATDVTHYGWEDFETRREAPSLIYSRTGAPHSPWMLLDMCFPYGLQAAIERGRGQMLALRITERAE